MLPVNQLCVCFNWSDESNVLKTLFYLIYCDIFMLTSVRIQETLWKKSALQFAIEKATWVLLVIMLIINDVKCHMDIIDKYSHQWESILTWYGSSSRHRAAKEFAVAACDWSVMTSLVFHTLSRTERENRVWYSVPDPFSEWYESSCTAPYQNHLFCLREVEHQSSLLTFSWLKVRSTELWHWIIWSIH